MYGKKYEIDSPIRLTSPKLIKVFGPFLTGLIVKTSLRPIMPPMPPASEYLSMLEHSMCSTMSSPQYVICVESNRGPTVTWRSSSTLVFGS